MTTLHTFGCSITQGFALPDVVRPLSPEDQRALGREPHWQDIHLYQPSSYAWPQQLADQLNMPVVNHARRGACFQQIARQVAVAAPTIRSDDVVIVMWTYLSRVSIQWPARTTVPFCTVVEPHRYGWRTMIVGFNKFFGLERSDNTTAATDQRIQQYIEHATKTVYLDPMGVYNRYYNNLILQITVDGLIRSTGARVIHLSVEPETLLDQLELARRDLDASLRDPYAIPNPSDWYRLAVDHLSCRVIHDPSIPSAPNDMHPSVDHHRNFAQHLHDQYF